MLVLCILNGLMMGVSIAYSHRIAFERSSRLYHVISVHAVFFILLPHPLHIADWRLWVWHSTLGISGTRFNQLALLEIYCL